MKIQHIFLSIGLIFCLYQPLNAQSFATNKNAVWLAFNANFTSLDGDGFSTQSITSIGVAPAFFIAKNVFIGIQGKSNFNNSGYQEWQVGPYVGYALGGENKKHFPYITAGAAYTHTKTEFSFSITNPYQPFTFDYYYTNHKAIFEGISTQFGIGYAITLRKHLALNVECGLQSSYLQHNSTQDNSKYKTSSTSFYGGLGISVMLFK